VVIKMDGIMYTLIFAMAAIWIAGFGTALVCMFILKKMGYFGIVRYRLSKWAGPGSGAGKPVETVNIHEDRFNTWLRQASKCPHGVERSSRKSIKFAGGVSRCECCDNVFGHFSNPAPRHCDACREDK